MLVALVGALPFNAAEAIAYTPAGELRDAMPWFILSIVWILFWLAVGFTVRGASSA
jgi:hypothetical protein